jgi:hypothetical protein
VVPNALFAGRKIHHSEVRGSLLRVYDPYVTRPAGKLLRPPERVVKVEPKGVAF